MTFTISQYKHGWIAACHNFPSWSATAESKEAVMQMCREYVALRTGRPASETTVMFFDGPTQ